MFFLLKKSGGFPAAGGAEAAAGRAARFIGGLLSKGQSVRRQATVLTCANGLVRALGFALHILLSRLLGAEALGVMELSHSAHMLSIAPVTAGLPLAVSRLTARRGDGAPLASGRSLALRISAALIPLWALAAPFIAGLLGDGRTLLPLWAFTPCIALLGLSAVYNGYCYGRGLAWPPALGTLTEQGLRFLLSAALLLSLPGLTVAARAAVPGLAALLAEGAALLLTRRLLRRQNALPRCAPEAGLRREILRLSLPLTASRLLQTLLRAALGALLPRRLVAGGMSGPAATAALGMLQGMVLPVLFLPGIFTGAVGMVGAPAIARLQGARLRAAAGQLFAASLACGLAGWAAIRLLAGFLAGTLYHLPRLAPLFRAAAPLTLLFSLQQAAGTVLSGLGEQKRTLLPTVAGAALTLYLTYHWAASPLGVEGAVWALMAGRAVSLLGELAEVLRATGSAGRAAPSGG